MGIIDRLFRPANPITAAVAERALDVARAAATAAEREAIAQETEAAWDDHRTAVIKVQQAEAHLRAAREREAAEAEQAVADKRAADEKRLGELRARIGAWPDELAPFADEFVKHEQAMARIVEQVQARVRDIEADAREASALERALGDDGSTPAHPTFTRAQTLVQQAVAQAAGPRSFLVAHWLPQSNSYAMRLASGMGSAAAAGNDAA